MLRFIYSDTADVTQETAWSLIYAAIKYMLPKLLKECQKFMLDGLEVDNAIYHLNQGLFYGMIEIANKCKSLILSNYGTILKGNQILAASRQAMETILKMEPSVIINELDIYEVCIKWAQHQLQEDIPNPTDLQIREVLGDLIYAVRFPTMNQKEFAKLTLRKHILTADEKESVYYYFATREVTDNMLFPVEKRHVHVEEMLLDRTEKRFMINGTYDPYIIPLSDVVNFQSNRDILLSAIGLFTGCIGSMYDADVEILQANNSSFWKRVHVPFTGDGIPVRISLDQPISVKAGVAYRVVTNVQDSMVCFGDSCKLVCTEGDITITFWRSTSVPDDTDVICGQIPRLYFYRI